MVERIHGMDEVGVRFPLGPQISGTQFVDLSKATTCFAEGNRTAESCFFIRKNGRAGAQTNSSDGKNLVAGDSPI